METTYTANMSSRTMPDDARLPLLRSHGLLIGVSLALLGAAAGLLWWAVPLLPAEVALRSNGLGSAVRLAPPTELWNSWGMAVGVWLVLALIAYAGSTASGVGRLNGAPPVTTETARHVRQTVRSLFLSIQLIVTLTTTALVGCSVLLGFGGADLTPLAALPIVAVPIVLAVSLFRLSAPA